MAILRERLLGESEEAASKGGRAGAKATFSMERSGVAAMALYIMTGFLLVMHGLQMLIFLGAFGDKIAMTRWEKWSILIFGIFALLDIRRKYMV